MRPRRAPRRRLPALRIVVGLAGYAAVLALLGGLDVLALLATPLPAPGWAPPAAALLLYAAVAAVWLGRRAPARVPVAAAALVALHVVLVAGTVAVLGPAGPGEGLAAAALGLPLLVPFQAAVVLWSLAPLRRVLEPAPRWARRSSSASPRPARPAWTPPPPAAPPPAPAPAAQPSVAARAAATVPAAVPAAPPAAPVEPPRAPAPPASPTPAVEVPADAGAGAPAGAPMGAEGRPVSGETRALPPEDLEEVVRIPFDRIADQLPAQAFRLPLDRLAANLLEPGHLLVPVRLVVPQLAEGLVHVGWDVVADQFPPNALATTERVRGLGTTALRLPLDEIVRQLPSDTFALGGPAVDVTAIEAFPLPFQPPAPAAEDGPVAGAAPAAEVAPVAGAAPAAEMEPATGAEATPAAGPDAGAQAGPDATGPDGPAAGTLRAEAVPEGPIEEEAEPEADGPAPVAVEHLRPDTAPIGWRRDLVGLASALRALEVDERVVREARLLTAVTGGVELPAAVATASRVLSLLGDRRLPEPVVQVTLRLSAGALVLTPLAGEEAVLAVGVGTPGSLALVERVALRAAGRRSGAARSAPPAARGREAAGPDLRETTVPARVRDVAGAVRAFGPLVPVVLRDAADALLACALVPAGTDPRPLAGVGHDLWRRLRDAEMGGLASATLRMAEGRIIVRELTGGRGHGSLLVVAGPVDRPGLAYLEVERAAARLSAL